MTQPVQEPTQGRTNEGLAFKQRQLFRRPGPDLSNAYLQPSVHSVYGPEWQVLNSDDAYKGGNGTDYIGGTWLYVADSAAPWGGYLETTVDDDWFAFTMPNLGPRYTGYAVAVWYYEDTDAPKLEIEWATGPIDEAGNTTPSAGSATSIVSPNDIAYNAAAAFDWYNTDNDADATHRWKWDAYNPAPGWGLVLERSPFFLGGTDGTPLTANAATDAGGTWEWNREFNGGGGPDIAWWVRIRVNGKHASSSGYNAKIAGIRVYRFNGASNALT